MNLDKQLDKMVAGFVGNLRKVIDQATREQVASALRAAVGTGGRGGQGAGRGKLVTAGGRRAKRSPKQIAAQTAKLFDYIKGHPGERMEQIVKGVGLATNLLQPLIKKLVADKKIKPKGQARGTTYTAA